MNFLISNFNIIFLTAWCVFFVIVAVRYFQPDWLKNISYWWLISGAVLLHLFYGLLATLLQYVVWGTTEFTKVFLVSPVAPEVPFHTMLEWARPLFDGSHGYFALYSFQHFFLSSLVLFFITALFSIYFRLYSAYRPFAISGEDVSVIALSFLIAGYMGAILLVPLAFIVAFILAVVSVSFKNFNQASLATSFLIVSPFVFLFATPILKYFSLYSIIKL